MQGNKENLTKWRDALLSGEYEQGKEYLAAIECGEVRYCCLGVACELAGVAYRDHPEDDTTSVRYYKDHAGRETATVLTVDAMEWLGLDIYSVSNQGPGWGKYPTLTMANDRGESFRTIAQAITELFDLEPAEA